MEKERTKALVIVVMLIVVAGLTVAFASLSSVLNIKGTAYLDAAKWGIKFENLSEPVSVGTASITGTATIEEAKSAEINGINVSLSTPGDKVVYTVDLVNEGTINAKIDKIEKTELTSEQQKYLTFKVTDKNGNEVSEGDILSSGETKKLIITIEFIKDLTKEDLPTNTSTISLSYKLNFVQTDEKKDTTSNEVQNELPSGYKRVEYLESTGTQYIVISKNMTFDENTTTTIEVAFTEAWTHDINLFGTLTNNFRFEMGQGWTGKGLSANRGLNGRQYVFNLNTQDKYLIKMYNGGIDINDTSATAVSSYFGNTDDWNKSGSVSKIALFTTIRDELLESRVSKAKIYSFTVGDMLNLIPCLDSDNKPCMYDTVSKKTFYNSGTGEFLYGNVID